MLFKSLFDYAVLGASLLTATASATTTHDHTVKRQAEPAPVKWGLLAFPGVDILDIYGPLEVLYFVAASRHLNVQIITPDANPIILNPPMGNRFNSTYEPHVVGQTTFAESLQQDDFDVLLVPGGAAARDPALTYVDDYLVEMFPKVKYFITVCTGALFAARAGLLDNRRATTNKGAWDLVTQHGENVTWVAPARFVIDGDVWSSSGVSAGIDLTFEFVKRFYGQELHDRITVFTEIVPRAHDDDPFTDIVGIPHQGQL